MQKNILLESYTAEQILDLPPEEVDELILTGVPLIFTAGSAQILGQFKIQDQRLVVELAHIEGGGEGVLIPLWLLAERYGKLRGLEEMEWIVHAIHCARPNPKLRPLLEKRGFTIRNLPEVGDAYWRLHPLKTSTKDDFKSNTRSTVI